MATAAAVATMCTKCTMCMLSHRRAHTSGTHHLSRKTNKVVIIHVYLCSNNNHIFFFFVSFTLAVSWARARACASISPRHIGRHISYLLSFPKRNSLIFRHIFFFFSRFWARLVRFSVRFELEPHMCAVCYARGALWIYNFFFLFYPCPSQR